MKNHRLTALLFAVMTAAMLMFAGCGAQQADSTEKASDPGIADGTYIATFTTDNSMFHVNDEYQDKGVLTVKDGEMSIHVTLGSKNIVNLFPGTAEDAQKEGAELLEPTTDTVTYSDGYTDEVYGFDVPVPALDEEFDLALVGTKGKWYDHKVKVSDPVEGDDIQAAVSAGSEGKSVSDLGLSDGEYTAEVSLEGGSGRATVDSPAGLRISGDECIAVITWSSPHYDYMIVDGQRYEPVNTEGNSVFEIPVLYFDKPMSVTADTTAMSEPHEIEYTLLFDSSSVK